MSPSLPSTSSQSSSIHPFCNFSCIGVVVLAPNSDPHSVVDEFWSSSSPFGAQALSCAPISLSYSSTHNGRRPLVLVQIEGPFDPQAQTLGARLFVSLSSVVVSVVAESVSVKSRSAVMVIEFQRHADEPAQAASSSLTLDMPCSGQPGASSPNFIVELGSSPAPLSEEEKTAIAVVSVLSADLQTVAAVGLLRCAPGSLGAAESDATIRALVPVALSATCVGAIQGALLSIGVACVAAICTTSIWKHARGLSWVEAAAAARCPGIVLSIWAAVQMGLIVCGGRLFTSNSDEIGDRVLGIAGLVCGAVLPSLSVCLTYLFASRRCYQLVQTPEAVASSSLLVVRLRSLLLPTYELDTTTLPVSAAFSTLVGPIRRASCLWAGLADRKSVV